MNSTAPKQETYSFCFNPNCAFPLQRIFKPQTNSLQHSTTCHKWILSKTNRLLFSSNRKQPLTSQTKEQLTFYTQPLQSLANFSWRKDTLRQALARVFDELKADLCQYINHCKNQKLNQFQRLAQETDTFLSVIRNSISKFQAQNCLSTAFIQNLAWNISSEFANPAFKDIKLIDIQLFNKEAIKSQAIKIKQVISSISDSLAREKQLEGELETVRLSDMIKAEKFLREDKSSEVFKVYQLCQWSQPDYTIKGSYSNTIKCPLCTFQFELPRSQFVKETNEEMKQLRRHLTIEHLSFIGYCYGQRMNKLKRDQITFEEILYLMQSQSFKELVIVDGVHCRCVDLELDPSKLYVSFAEGPPNPGECECRWLFVSSFEDAGFYTVLLIYEILIKLGKGLRIVGFKKHYYQLYKKLIDLKNLVKFKIEDKLKQKKALLQQS